MAKLYSSLLDKSKEVDGLLRPALLKNLVLIGCAILLKETVNLNKLKNAIGLLVVNEETLPNSHYRRLTRFFDQEIAKRHLWKWLMIWLIGYIRRWDGRSTSLFLTLDGTSLNASPVTIWSNQNSLAGTEPCLSGYQFAYFLG